MITDASYFEKGELFLPNANDGNVGSFIEGNLDMTIKRYERQLLIGALGIDVYKELVTVYPSISTAAQKWKDLVNGVDYSIGQYSYHWEGLKGQNKEGVIAHYVYCQYLKQDEIEYSTTGMARNAVANATSARYIEKYVSAWSNFREKYQGEQFYERSLLQFLRDNEPDWPFTDYRTYGAVNRFGI